MKFKHLLICSLLTCLVLQACHNQNSQHNHTDIDSVKQAVMPKDTFLSRLSAVVNGLAEETWDSANIVHLLTATPERYFVAIRPTPDSVLEKPGSNVLVVRPIGGNDLKFDLYISIPDTLANHLSYKDFNSRFGQPVKDSIAGIPVIAPKEPLISYRVSKGHNRVNIVLYSGIINHSGTESIYGLLIYK